ncbi:hypothetical protein ACFW9X_28730, partial [Streptomyces sp. NPDC059466]|uniref:hypothetical protein n=1 Tax=Streptomyces sp. NPDC059466 TaxID=3346843 RepID=UPI0036A3AF14
MDFTSRTQDIAPEDVAPDMHDLAAQVRNLMHLQRGAPLKLPLGGALLCKLVAPAPPPRGAVYQIRA